MKKIFCFLFALTFFAACGDSGTNAGDSSKEKAVAPDLRVESMSMLPNCTETHKGEIALVTDFYNTYKCKNGEWTMLLRATVKTLDDLSNCIVDSYKASELKVLVNVESEDAAYVCKEKKWIRVVDNPDGSNISTMKDDRDGQVYKTVEFGDQVWMAENLNYKTDSSFCYNDSAEYCDKYGRLYSQRAAISACPKGWHLPDTTEWNKLIALLGGEEYSDQLLQLNPGFAALPAGKIEVQVLLSVVKEITAGEGEIAAFWSSTDSFCTGWNFGFNGVKYPTADSRSWLSVRCVKD